jgi:hypothetical protein
LRRSYQEAGAIFQTSTDSEVLVHLIADPMFRTRPRRVERALAELQGAFSFLIMTKDSVMAARDPYGFRPLSIGKLGSGYVFASETCALEQVGADYIRDVLPGELVTVDEKGIRSTTFCEPISGSLGQCIFEHVYFARPDSTVFRPKRARRPGKLGHNLAREAPVKADIVIPIPDSGNVAALGYSQESGIPLDYGFIRNHYIGRTFIMPTVGQRAESADMKLAVVPGVVRGKRIIVVDDSLIRGTTSRRRVHSLARSRGQGNPPAHFLPARPAIPVISASISPPGPSWSPPKQRRGNLQIYRGRFPRLSQPRRVARLGGAPHRLLQRLFYRRLPVPVAGELDKHAHEVGGGNHDLRLRTTETALHLPANFGTEIREIDYDELSYTDDQPRVAGGAGVVRSAF